jgi:hypothetical protein
MLIVLNLVCQAGCVKKFRVGDAPRQEVMLNPPSHTISYHTMPSWYTHASKIVL